MSSTALGVQQKVSAIAAAAPAAANVSPSLLGAAGPAEKFIPQNSSLPAALLRAMARPWVDKAIAAVVSVPALWVAYGCYRDGLMNVPRGLFFAQAALYVLTMVTRRSPVRISNNLWFWVVASLNTYYNLLTAGLVRGGSAIAPASLINTLAVLGIWIVLLGRLSLGRNIGLVPAQRRIVTTGMYRYVRHPIYTAYFFCALSLWASCCSWLNTLVIGVGCFLYVLKTFMEESFLRQDPEYAAYMKKVRWRWFPGLA